MSHRINPDDPPTCCKCGDEYFLKDGFEVTDYCDPCAQELVPELIEALQQIRDLERRNFREAWDMLKEVDRLASAAIRKAKGGL